MSSAGGVVQNMLAATYKGTAVLFGELGLPNAGRFGALISDTAHPNAGSIFAFQVLPTIIFISAFFALLYHIGVMQIIIRALAWIMLLLPMFVVLGLIYLMMRRPRSIETSSAGL